MDRDQVGDVAHELGARLHELAVRQATLEEAFLEATGLSEEFIGRRCADRRSRDRDGGGGDRRVARTSGGGW